MHSLSLRPSPSSATFRRTPSISGSPRLQFYPNAASTKDDVPRILWAPSAALRSSITCGGDLPFASLSVDPSSLSSAVGSPPSLPLISSRWSLERRHTHILSLTACAAALSAAWLFLSAIPTLLAFKKAAESLEKLLDVTAEELPDTMAAVRLSGMEISDLTMELSDLGQEIAKGVRSSTQAVHVAEDRLRRLTTMTPTVSMQVQSIPSNKNEVPIAARTARNLRDGLVKGRIAFRVLVSITQFSRWALKFCAARGKKASV